MYGRKRCDEINGCGKFYRQHFTECPFCSASDAFSNLVVFDRRDVVYDLETYPNVFTASFKHMGTGKRVRYEISDRANQMPDLISFLKYLIANDCRLIGFNNLGFDYPIIHFILMSITSPSVTDVYNKAMQIINTPWSNRYDHVIWDNEVLIPQLDLYKIHHFDNDARRTSLKMLEFNMRSENVQDLPFEPGTFLSFDQIDALITYNDHDVDETGDFYAQTIEMIEFREQLSAKFNRDFMNHNDTKIGKDFFIMELEKSLGRNACYTRDENGKRQPMQTIRSVINLNDVIFPYIIFRSPEFNRIKQWFASQQITQTKGVFNDLNATVKGFSYVFGVGGIHGSIPPAVIESDDDYVIYDWDVKSYYPNIAIANNLHPAHLGDAFCSIYKEVYKQRSRYQKGTPENAMLKLALNGVYGDSNNKYSPFYDPQYTMAITINGQLLLCMLAEKLTDIPGIEMIQINTDGLTVRLHRSLIDAMNAVCDWWQQYTHLELEHVVYSRMFIRDVNNYIAEDEDGKLKRKGAYGYETPHDNPTTQERLWHKNHSSLVIPKAAEAALIYDQNVGDFIRNHDDIYDFMLRTKVGRKDKLMFTRAGMVPTELQKITRYYISKTGGVMSKISPPARDAKIGQWKRANGLTDQFYNNVISKLKALPQQNEVDVTGVPWDERINTKNKSKYKLRITEYHVGWLITPCNDMSPPFNPVNIDYDYYIAEAEKLIQPLRDGL